MIIHGKSSGALKHLREKPAALAVFWVYASRTNNEGVAWPSLRGLERDTGWNKGTCQEGREWLVQHGALEEVAGYVRPDWRDMDETEKQNRLNLDRTKYYRVTGVLKIGSETYSLLYFPGNDANNVDDTGQDDEANNPDVRSCRTSVAPDVRPDRTELSTSNSKLGTNQSGAPPKPTPKEADAAIFTPPDDLIDPDTAQVHQALDAAGIIVTGLLRETINADIADGHAADILDAIKITSARKPGNPTGYLKTILDNKRAEREKAEREKAERAAKQAAADEITDFARAQTRAVLRGETPPVPTEVDDVAA